VGNADASLEPAEAVLGRVVEGRGRLLRVERGAGPPAAPPRLRLAFETGVVAIEPDAAGAALEARLETTLQAPAALDSADEEDPWWTLLGHPLTRVAAREEGTLLLQFRPDAESPKILVLAPAPGAVRVRTLV
jgi:hypothetical protein